MTLYIGDWQDPVLRDDWIYTPSLMASYAFNPNLTVEASWSYDNAVNQDTNTPTNNGREFKRNLVAASLKYTF